MHQQTDITLKITEIYASIQGESTYAGYPCTFIRLTGCPLRCRWCDTVHSFHGGEDRSIGEIVDEVEKLNIGMVELTGGEPLAQPQTPKLAKALVDSGFKLLIETSGSEPIDTLPESTHIVMDIKCPGSGMVDRNRWENIAHIKKTDDLKFVLADRADFEWAVTEIRERQLDKKANILLSCAFGLLQPKDLAAWMLEAGVSYRLQLQQHKYIWHPRAKGV